MTTPERPSPDRVRALGLAFRESRVVLSAVELGLFAALAAGREAGFAEARVLELSPTVSLAVGTK